MENNQFSSLIFQNLFEVFIDKYLRLEKYKK